MNIEEISQDIGSALDNAHIKASAVTLGVVSTHPLIMGPLFYYLDKPVAALSVLTIGTIGLGIARMVYNSAERFHIRRRSQ